MTLLSNSLEDPLHFSNLMCNTEIAVDSFQQRKKKLPTTKDHGENVFNSFSCSIFMLHTFYELEQRIVLFILASGAVHDKMQKCICRPKELK